MNVTKIKMNIIKWMVEAGFAENPFEAYHIANGLRLIELHDNTEAQQARVKLYRDWRNSKVYGTKTAPCYEKAIAGEAAPTPLMPEALHSYD